jgi:methylaspartate ammonia-lyase
MPRIERVVAVPVAGAYYCEDLTALQANPIPLPERYTAQPATAGFSAVRQVAEAVAVGLVLDDGRVAWGDCVSVAYGGKAGREPVLRAEPGLEAILRTVAPFLQGRAITGFRGLAAEADALLDSVQETRPVPAAESPGAPRLSRRDLLRMPARVWQSLGSENTAGAAPETTETVTVRRPLHSAIRYGVSQALLQAAAWARGVTMAEVIAEEWGLPRPDAPAPIHAQSGSERIHNADKMIVRRVASLPHALVDDIPAQLGSDGGLLVQYTRWLAGRIRELGGPDYHPTIHLDLHGALGQICDGNLGRVLGQLYALETAAQPYALRIECPLLLDTRAAQIQAFKALRDYVRARKMKTQLVADEWANTLDDIRAFLDAGAADMIQIKMPDLGSLHNSIAAVLACQAAATGAFLGGSCAETELSARASVHVALATRPAIVMAKPGMGVDEAVSFTQNEMARALAEIRTRGK